MDLQSELARARREATEARARVALERSRGVLRATAARMQGDDLDSAWVMALRGDIDLALARMAPHVPTVKRRRRKGTPWRSSKRG